MKPVLAVFAALQLLIGALLWLAPRFFYGGRVIERRQAPAASPAIPTSSDKARSRTPSAW